MPLGLIKPNMSDLFTLFEIAQIKAIHNALEPTMDSIWRARCRDYSKRFYTPLHVVMEDLDPEMVLLALNEERYPISCVEEELPELMETLYKIKDPSYTSISKEDIEAMVDNVLNKENARYNKKKTKEQIEVKKTAPENILKSGGMSFSNLENIEAKAENNTAGFED